MTGGIVGAMIGVAIAKGMAFAGARALGSELIQAQIGLGLLVGAVLFSFVVGTIAGVAPAIRASKMQPVEALRFSK